MDIRQQLFWNIYPRNGLDRVYDALHTIQFSQSQTCRNYSKISPFQQNNWIKSQFSQLFYRYFCQTPFFMQHFLENDSIEISASQNFPSWPCILVCFVCYKKKRKTFSQGSKLDKMRHSFHFLPSIRQWKTEDQLHRFSPHLLDDTIQTRQWKSTTKIFNLWKIVWKSPRSLNLFSDY